MTPDYMAVECPGDRPVVHCDGLLLTEHQDGYGELDLYVDVPIFDEKLAVIRVVRRVIMTIKTPIGAYRRAGAYMAGTPPSETLKPIEAPPVRVVQDQKPSKDAGSTAMQGYG